MFSLMVLLVYKIVFCMKLKQKYYIGIKNAANFFELHTSPNSLCAFVNFTKIYTMKMVAHL